jgi:hypothetical protein
MKRPSIKLLLAAALPLGLASIAVLSAVGAAAPALQTLPTPFPESRYQQMSAKSPFSVATANGPAAAPTPGFAAQLYLNGLGNIGGKDYAAIKSRDPDKPGVIWLKVGEPNTDGMKVERVQISDDPGKSTADVVLNGERATLTFDQAQLHAGPPAGAMPGAPNMPGGAIQLPRIPGRPVGIAGQQPILNQPGQPAGPNIFPQPVGAPNNPGSPSYPLRRRLRPIMSGQ